MTEQDLWPSLCERGHQPKWDPADDDLVFTRVGECMAISTRSAKGERTGEIIISLFNCWALIGVLSLFIGLPLPKKLRKEIRFGFRPKPPESASEPIP